MACPLSTFSSTASPRAPLLPSDLLRDVFGIPRQINDETLVSTWVRITSVITTLNDFAPERPI
jgi:hypothetical protein